MAETKKEPAYLKDLHFEHVTWKNELLFWQDEIATFENRLADIVREATDKHVLAQLERFQNQFIRHREIIDILKHDINEHEHGLSEFARNNPVSVDKMRYKDHGAMRQRMEMQRQLYQELKGDFFKYLAQLI